MYRKYLAEFWYSTKALETSKASFFVLSSGIYGEVGVNTFRNATGAHYLPHSREYVAPLSIDIVRPWFETIGEATKGGSSKAPTSSKTSHLKGIKESILAMDSNRGQTSASTIVVAKMHKEGQQATGGPTYLGVTSKERADPQLSSDKTQYVSEGLETVLTHPITGKGASSIARQVEKDKASRTIKLEDLAKLVSGVQPSFKDLDSLKDDPIIVVDENDEDEEAKKVHSTTNVEIKDTLVPKLSYTRSSQIQKLTNQVLIFQSQQHKLKLEKNKAEAEAALLRAQPIFPNIGQLNELLFNELIKEVKGLKKQVHNLEIELPRELKELPTKLRDFTKTVIGLTFQVTKLKTLQWDLPTEFLSVPTQVEVIHAKLEILDALPTNTTTYNTNHSSSHHNHHNSNTISFSQKSTKRSSQPEGEHIKKDKGKKGLSSEEPKKVSINNDPDDDETHVTVFIVESSRIKKVKKFDFVTKDGKHIHLTGEQINQRKNIQEEAKAEAAKHESEIKKKSWLIFLVHRAESRITNYDVLTGKSPITLKVYREDGTSEIIPNFKATDLHLGEWREVLNACPNRTGKRMDNHL
uniref:Uncharacterized protein n=1 Tax=Tanacetum cinerariifolium TaxID=118510 RepID=A0A699GX46_TANCI|nr:hypothetical protein [Tanacetum cinerariifolium]